MTRRPAVISLATTALLSRVLVVPKDGVALFRAAQRLDLEGIAPSYETKCDVTMGSLIGRWFPQIALGC